MSDTSPPAGPDAMRALVADYVRALHTTYLQQVGRLGPAERAALPLSGGEQITVIAAAARRLHLVATGDRLPPPSGPEVELADEELGLSWIVRFYDPSVLPELGLVDDEPAEIRRLLGVSNTRYHLTVDVGGGLGAHHAQHSGVALANQHTKTARDLDRVRRALPRRTLEVDELATCVRNGLDRAAALLAADLTGQAVPARGTSAALCLESVVRAVVR